MLISHTLCLRWEFAEPYGRIERASLPNAYTGQVNSRDLLQIFPWGYGQNILRISQYQLYAPYCIFGYSRNILRFSLDNYFVEYSSNIIKSMCMEYPYLIPNVVGFYAYWVSKFRILFAMKVTDIAKGHDKLD